MPGEDNGRTINVADFYRIWGFYPIAGGEGEGDGSGDGNGNAGGEVQQQLTDALTKVGVAETELKSLKDAKVDLERKLDDADKELLSEDYLNFKEDKGKGKKNNGEGGSGEGSGDANFDINSASNAELLAHVGKQSKGDIDKVVKDLSSRMEKADERVGLALAQVDISLTAMRYPDANGLGFNENFDAIKKIAKGNPEWGAEKCYQQFKLERLHEDKSKADADAKKAEEDRRVLTEKGEGVPAGATQTKELTKEEAADLAYRKAFGTREP
ncbi:hypothetical protein LCGC14_0712630 [marine sediment metagenome]|uniref:Scaffolding protein n=1 Tax=marine sediment metagenome TaxID=412755 RepID=A0A0F9R009_9ZZZZ